MTIRRINYYTLLNVTIIFDLMSLRQTNISIFRLKIKFRFKLLQREWHVDGETEILGAIIIIPFILGGIYRGTYEWI